MLRSFCHGRGCHGHSYRGIIIVVTVFIVVVVMVMVVIIVVVMVSMVLDVVVDSPGGD